MKLFLGLVFLLSAFGRLAARGEECPCTLRPSSRYPGTFKWDCMNLDLTVVPVQCYNTKSSGVSELWLSSNRISSVRTIDAVGLTDLKELHLDDNVVEFFDFSTLDASRSLELFDASHNERMIAPDLSFELQTELKVVRLIGCKAMVALPRLDASSKLEVVDLRSSDLTTLPRPLFGHLSGQDFLFNLIGNQVVDIAADILLPLPEGATVNLDNFVLIWAKDNAEKKEVLAKNWQITLDLSKSIKICDKDGSPSDETMC